MLTDFRALVLHLSDTIEDRSVSRDGCRAVLMMEELRERLLAAEPTRKKTGEIPSSDVTIFKNRPEPLPIALLWVVRFNVLPGTGCR